MVLIGAIVFVFGFLILVKLFALVENNIRVVEISKSAVSIILDPEIADFQKEVAMQKFAKQLLPLFFLISITTILAIAIPFGLIWLMELAKICSLKKVIEMLMSIEFIIFSILISIILVGISLKRK